MMGLFYICIVLNERDIGIRVSLNFVQKHFDKRRKMLKIPPFVAYNFRADFPAVTVKIIQYSRNIFCTLIRYPPFCFIDNVMGGMGSGREDKLSLYGLTSFILKPSQA